MQNRCCFSIAMLILAAAVCGHQAESPSHMNWTIVWIGSSQWEEHYFPQWLRKAAVPLHQQVVELPLDLKNVTAFSECCAVDRTFLVLRFMRPMRDANMNPLAVLRLWLHRFKRVVAYLPGQEKGNMGSCTCGSCGRVVDEAPLVLRNYWSRDCAARSHVLNLPMGVKNGVDPGKVYGGRTGLASKVRGNVWFWASKHRTGLRNEMTAALIKAAGHVPHKLLMGNEVSDYIGEMCNTSLALTPRGNSPDTWRMYETMECGTLPVIDKQAADYYRQWVPQALVDTWLVWPDMESNPLRTIPKELMTVDAATHTALESRRKQMIEEYHNWKTSLVRAMRSALADLDLDLDRVSLAPHQRVLPINSTSAKDGFGRAWFCGHDDLQPGCMWTPEERNRRQRLNAKGQDQFNDFDGLSYGHYPLRGEGGSARLA
mmetsp:Transcript_75101/g.125193  ORF Transcript_75101/g.125193 Transcript_75101/m.125193 type:complete len:429 (+) Transcript_75101:76-1362(+)